MALTRRVACKVRGAGRPRLKGASGMVALFGTEQPLF